MQLLMIGGKLNCNEKEAMAFVNMTASMFDEYKRNKVIRPLRKGLYNYQDLHDAIVKIREERDKVIHMNPQKDEPDEEAKPQPHTPFKSTEELMKRHAK